MTLTVGTDNSSTIFNGAILDASPNQFGTLSLVKVGAGILTLGNFSDNGAGTPNLSDYSGGTTVKGGAIAIPFDSGLGAVPQSASPDNLVLNGTIAAPAALEAIGTFALNANRGIALGTNNSASGGALDVSAGNTLTYAGIIANNGGTNSLSVGVLPGDSGTLVLTNTSNTYSGGTFIKGGTLNIAADGTLGPAPNTAAVNITFDGNGTLQLVNNFGTLATTRSILVAAGDSGTLDIQGNNINLPNAITVSTGGTFGKQGSGTLELDSAISLASNSALQVGSGLLRMPTAASVGSNAVTATVSSGATLELVGSASILGKTVNVVNNSQTATTGGLYVFGTNQVLGTITGSGNTVIGTAANPGSLTAYQIVQNSLTIHGTGTTAATSGSVTLVPSGSGSTTNPTNPNNINFSSSLTSLSIDNNGGALLTGARVYFGTLDIGNNGLVIAYGSGADPYTSIDDMIRSGFDSAHWDGTGITSSLGRAAANSHTPLNIGLLDFTPGLHGDGTFTVFQGQTITTNAILVGLTYMDDINLFGDMSIQHAASDALLFAANFGVGTTWSVGDLTHDGQIGSPDALLFAANYATGLPSLYGTTGGATTIGGNTAAVPEPASLMLAALGAGSLAVIARRRRR